MRNATDTDLPFIQAFLRARIDQAMFPLANLLDHGFVEGEFASPHPHAMQLWRLGDGVVGLTRSGMLFPYFEGRVDLVAYCERLVGKTIAGVIGPAASARRAIAALGIGRLPTDIDRDEPGFGLDLAQLVLPELPETTLRPLTHADLPLVTGWRETYIGEVLGSFGLEARARAEADVQGYLARDSHRLLIDQGRPVALTGFNATLPEIVQIGGVYTPAPLRGRGYARRAVALHLAEARGHGTTRAVLFAASDAAAQAYRAIGFQPTGPFTLFLLSTPGVIPR